MNLFVVENSKAKSIPVDTGLENDGFIEITGKDIKPGMKVVTMGQDRLTEGTPVSILREE